MRLVAFAGTALRAAVIASLAVAAASAAWHVAGLDAVVAPPPPMRAEAPLPVQPPETAPILSAALFGSAAPRAETARTAPSDLALRGVFLDSDGTGSRAFIFGAGRTASYGLGDEVPGGGTVAQIEEARVVLAVGAERIVLTFAGAAAEGPRDPTSAEALAGAIRTPDAAAFIDLSPDGTAPQTMEDHLAMWRDRIMRNPGEVLDQIGLIPTESGYRIAPKHDSGVGLAGLRAGDLVTSVNGRPVGDVEADRRQLDAIEAEGQARLEIEREGRTIVLSFPLR